MKLITKNTLWLTVCLGIGTIGLCTEPFAEGLARNNLAFWISNCTSSLTAAQSRNPRHRIAMPVVSLNRAQPYLRHTWPPKHPTSFWPAPKGPYLGQIPPGSTAQVFAPGLICRTGYGHWESNGTFSADGNTFCYKQRSKVYITENTDQGWTLPKHIKSIPANNWSPYLSPDANTIYFSLAYLNPSSPFNRFNLFRCDRSLGPWSLPQELGPPLSSSGAEWGFSIAADNSFYFSSTRKGGRGGDDIWHAPFTSNTWSQAIHLPALNTPFNDAGPGIAPDQSFMVFNSIKPGGLGGVDLYLTLRRSDGTWTPPRNLGPRVNSAYHDFGCYVSPDKKYLFFSRRTGGNPSHDAADIYWVELKAYVLDPNGPEGTALSSP